MEGYTRSRYLAMAFYDLKVHSGPGPYLYNGETYDAEKLYDVMMTDISGVPTIPGTFPVASWYHPMMGYDAGYYSYIWSETLAADLFSEFENSESTTVINSVLGAKYRETILSPCAMLDGSSMLRNFLGREASNEAFLKRVIEK
jgi:thimet oligopeptidase